MRPIRHAVLLLSILTLAVMVLPAAPAGAQTNEAEALSPSEINQIQREIREKERRVNNFDSAIGKLRSGARQSSNSSLRKAVDNSMELMADAIRFEEQKFGQDNLIKMHGQYVKPTSYAELSKSRGVRTRRWNGYTGTGTLPIEYLRLVRMQEIYVSCKKMQELAVTRQGDAPERFGNITLEFDNILKADLDELKALLPEDAGPGYDSPYGINPDGSSKKKD